jgi:hypothetical protein
LGTRLLRTALREDLRADREKFSTLNKNRLLSLSTYDSCTWRDKETRTYLLSFVD